MTKHEGDR